MAVLAGFARRERRERADRQAEVEADAVDMAGTDAGAGQDQQTVLGQELAQFLHQRQDRVGPRSMIERPPILTTCTQGRSRIGERPRPGG